MDINSLERFYSPEIPLETCCIMTIGALQHTTIEPEKSKDSAALEL
jgi:hypothetical protein